MGVSGVSKSQLVNVIVLLRLLIKSIIVMRKTKVLPFWSGCNVDFALSVGCNDLALSVIMIILFNKIK